jgi:ribosomal protein S18 acetylase RimI-like enzyme
MIDIKHFEHQDTAAVRGLLLDIHAEVHADSDDAFRRRERFAGFVDAWSANASWRCVIGYDGDEPVGFAYGASFRPGGWWKGSPLPDGYEQSPTFALSELMVRAKWRKTDASAALHDGLLQQCEADRVTLLVDAEHDKVQRLYESWGYRKIQEQKPFEDSPLFAVMVRDLRE